MPQVSVIQTEIADLDGVFNAGVPPSQTELGKTASGGVSADLNLAKTAAVAEALERYVATVFAPETKTAQDLPHDAVRIDPEDWSLFSDEQRANPSFPFTNFYQQSHYAQVYSLVDNSDVWVPSSLIGLSASHGMHFVTSNGLAAGKSPYMAMLRGLEELIERDAFMTAWLNGLTPPSIALPKKYTQPVAERAGSVIALDISPAYTSHKIVAVMGSIPLRGKQRFSLGMAARPTYAEALDKAYNEWQQGVVFVGKRSQSLEPSDIATPAQADSFDNHALYYSFHSDEWQQLPFLQATKPITVDMQPKPAVSDKEALHKLVFELKSHNIRTYYANLTTQEVLQAGLHVVRVLSPDLVPLDSDANWPFLGGTAHDYVSRFAWAKQHKFPYVMPHPLG